MWTPDTAKSHPPAVQTFCLWGEASQKKVGQNGEELKKFFFSFQTEDELRVAPRVNMKSIKDYFDLEIM